LGTEVVEKNFQPGEVLIKLKNNSEVYRFKFGTNSDLQAIISQYENRPEVEYVELNYKYKITAFPNDPILKAIIFISHSPKTAGQRNWVEKEMNGFSSVTIAILDTGVDIDTPI